MTRKSAGTAALTAALGAAAVGLVLAPVSQADDACGPAMYFNVATNQCEFYPAVGPGPVGPGPVGPGPVGPGPVGPGPVGPGPVGPGPFGPGR